MQKTWFVAGLKGTVDIDHVAVGRTYYAPDDLCETQEEADARLTERAALSVAAARASADEEVAKVEAEWAERLAERGLTLALAERKHA